MKIKKVNELELNENIELKRTMDDHSRDIYRNNVHIGNLLWHPTREPRIRLNEQSDYFLTVSELQYILDMFQILKTQ